MSPLDTTNSFACSSFIHLRVLQPTGMVDIHQPEYWGYIQFSSGAPNTTAAVKDPSWTLRSVAMQIYYAQVRI